MKKLLLIAASAVLFFSCSSEKYKIEGNIENATDQMVYLKTMVGNELVTTDSTMMTGGLFTLKGNVEVPDLFAIDFAQQQDRIILFVENSEISIKGTVDNIMASEITGSATHDLLMEFNVLQEQLSEGIMDVQFRYQQAAMDGSLTPQLEEELRSEFMAENDKMVASLKDFAMQHTNSVVSAYIALSQLASFITTEELDSLVMNFPKEIQGSPFVKALNEKLEKDKQTAIGQPFIDFTHPDVDGNLVTFSSITGEKYILLDFWAGWCAPCRRENPHLVKLYNQFKDKGFDIFGVSLDRSKEEWLDAISADGLQWHQVSDVTGWENPVAKMYGVQSIPANLLISPEGKIIAKNLRGEELEKKLTEIFN